MPVNLMNCKLYLRDFVKAHLSEEVVKIGVRFLIGIILYTVNSPIVCDAEHKKPIAFVEGITQAQDVMKQLGVVFMEFSFKIKRFGFSSRQDALNIKHR